ncbi:GNAT family N-acetyltransferase [Jatrophihabitans fulvus]
MIDAPELRTHRLLLRRWRQSDREPFAALNADPEVTHFLRGSLDREESDRFADRIEASFEEHGYGLWAVELQSSGEFLGFTGLALQTYDAPFTPAVEVGWRYARSAWHHGYATEAARAAVDFAFGPAGLADIVSVTAAANEPSRAVMRRLGMTYDPGDDFEQPGFADGHPLRPGVVYRLTRERWVR